MASPYTQNIEQSQVYKRATGEDRNILDDVLDISQELKSKADNKLNANMEKLQRDNVFEIQATKNQMRNLNEISKIQEEIQSQYNNDVRAWAEAREKNAMIEEARNKYGANNAEDSKIDIRFPEEAYGEVFNTRVGNVVNRYNDLIKDLEGKGLPYRDLDKGDKFIDDVYTGIYDNLTDLNSTNVFNNLGSIFRGQGLNAPDAKSLKTQFNARVAMSNLSDIETINEKWKALYSLSPGLAADYKKIITDKSIVRKDVEFVTDDEVFSKQVRDEKTGRITDRKYKMSYMQYIDREGNPTRTEPVEILLREQEDLTEYSLAEREMYLSLLKPEGKEQFLNLIDDENYTPTKAFKDLRQNGLIKSKEELQETATRRNLAANITELFADKQATYFVEDPMGNSVLRSDIALWQTGKGPRPIDFFTSEKEYARHLLGQQVDIIYGQQITMKDITSELILDEELAERIDAGGGDSTTFREMLDSEEMTTRYKNALQVVGSNEEALTQRYVVGQFEADERFGAMNENGSYFGRPMSNDDKIINGLIILPDESFLPASVKAKMEQNPNITPLYFKDVGLEDVITNEYDVTFDKPVHVGWNVNEKKLVFKSVDMGRTTEDVDKGMTIPQAILGENVASFMFGDDMTIDTIGDYAWFIPGFGAVGMSARFLIKGTSKIALPAIGKYVINSPKGLKAINKFKNSFKATKNKTFEQNVAAFKQTKSYKNMNGFNKAILDNMNAKGNVNINQFIKTLAKDNYGKIIAATATGTAVGGSIADYNRREEEGMR
jgi:hypothetical protein